jgi:hypothetical protein
VTARLPVWVSRWRREFGFVHQILGEPASASNPAVCQSVGSGNFQASVLLVLGLGERRNCFLQNWPFPSLNLSVALCFYSV